MKKFLSFIAAIALLLTGCDQFGQNSNNGGNDNKNPFSSADLEKLDGFAAEGGSVTLPFTPAYDWTAEADKAWIRVSPKSGTAGEESRLKVRLDENTDTEEREGNVLVKLSNGSEFNIPVRQLGAQEGGDDEVPTVNLEDGASYQIDKNGGELEVKLSTNTEYNVKIEEGADWLSYVETRAMREETLVFSATKNDSGAVREAEVTLTYEGDHVKFTIYQEKATEQGGDDDNTPTPSGTTIADVLEGELGNYTVKNAWAVATYNRGCLLTDKSGAYILAYNPSVTPAVGEEIKISGEVTEWGGLKQFKDGSTITETGEIITVNLPVAEIMDGVALDAYLAAPYVKYVEYEGVLSISNNYYNINVEGATTAVGAIQYPDATLASQLAELNGKFIKVRGFLIGVSSSKFANTMAVSVVQSENEAPETPVVSIADITKGGTFAVNGAWAVATYDRGCLLTDKSGAYILAYNPSVTPDVGEVVNIQGNVSSYAGLLQFGQGSTITKTGETKSVTHPTAKVMDGAALDAYLNAPSVMYVEYEGVLSISNNYYNIEVEGATAAIGAIQYPTSDMQSALNVLSGKKIKVAGYLIGSLKSMYANTMVVSVTEVTQGSDSPGNTDGNGTEDFAPGSEQNPGWV